jgi:hypothetical protein
MFPAFAVLSIWSNERFSVAESSQTVARNVLPIHDALKELKLDPSFERITRPLFPFKNRIDILLKVQIL